MQKFFNRYEFEGEAIPIERFGQDHWSTLAYFETVATDKKGIIDNRRMRCNPRLHRSLANMSGFGIIDGSKYPTRLKEGQIENHDDWSCLEDMVAAGLVEAFTRIKYPEEVFGNMEAKIKLTPLGFKIAHELREFKAKGGIYANFEAEKKPCEN